MQRLGFIIQSAFHIIHFLKVFRHIIGKGDSLPQTVPCLDDTFVIRSPLMMMKNSPHATVLIMLVSLRTADFIGGEFLQLPSIVRLELSPMGKRS